MRSIPRLALILSLTAVLAVPISPAHAKAPPRGEYECTIGYPPIGFGTIVIKKDKKYKHGYDPPFKKGGKFKNPSGNKIRFKSGPMKGSPASGRGPTTVLSSSCATPRTGSRTSTA